MNINKFFFKFIQIIFLFSSFVGYFLIYIMTTKSDKILTTGISFVLFLYSWFLITKPAIKHIFFKKQKIKTKISLKRHLYNFSWLCFSLFYNLYFFHQKLDLSFKLSDFFVYLFFGIVLFVAYWVTFKFVELIINET